VRQCDRYLVPQNVYLVGKEIGFNVRNFDLKLSLCLFSHGPGSAVILDMRSFTPHHGICPSLSNGI